MPAKRGASAPEDGITKADVIGFRKRIELTKVRLAQEPKVMVQVGPDGPFTAIINGYRLSWGPGPVELPATMAKLVQRSIDSTAAQEARARASWGSR